ncbi:MAG: ABC transporter ATP-binding protein, partial [Ruminococcus sp.]
MEILNVKDLTFSYPESKTKAIDNISFSVNSGEFVVVCGESGSGKTTLLKMLKKEIAPHGTKSGEVIFNGESIDTMEERESAQKIGFVFQKPEQQIVTDKVWHELAFGLESLGYDSDFIRLRVGEMANYFGINHMFRSKTQELSGGQKQLMNLASVMAMSPQVLILDEPTSQLDPIAANDFITTLRKLNNELGITVIIIEHRLQEVFPIADKVMVLEKGKMIAFDTPKKVCQELRNHPISAGFPSAVRIWQGAKIGGDCPLTVKEGRIFINDNFSERKIEIKKPTLDPNIQLELKEVFFRYEKGSADVLRGTTLKVHKGEHYCLLGGNGSGKTTTLKILAGIIKPYRGKVIVKGEKTNRLNTQQYNRLGVALLPQNPETVFIKSSVIED